MGANSHGQSTSPSVLEEIKRLHQEADDYRLSKFAAADREYFGDIQTERVAHIDLHNSKNEDVPTASTKEDLYTQGYCKLC
jgi:hypothetical protein